MTDQSEPPKKETLGEKQIGKIADFEIMIIEYFNKFFMYSDLKVERVYENDDPFKSKFMGVRVSVNTGRLRCDHFISADEIFLCICLKTLARHTINKIYNSLFS